jgi:hypothetical protein
MQVFRQGRRYDPAMTPDRALAAYLITLSIIFAGVGINELIRRWRNR